MTDFTVFDVETTGRHPWSASLLRAGIGSIPWRMPTARTKMRDLLARPGVIVEHTLFDARWALLDGARLGAETSIHDTRVMAWLLDEEQKLDLAALMLRYLGEEIVKPIVQRANQPVWSTAVIAIPGDARPYVPLAEVPDALWDEYNAADLDEEARLYAHLRDLLRGEDLWTMFLRDEAPLTTSIARMEARGLPFATRSCEELRAQVRIEAEELAGDLHRVCGAPLNLRSSAQVGAYLFSKGAIHVKGKLETNPEWLERFADVPRADRLAALNASDALPENFQASSFGPKWTQGAWKLEGRALKSPRPKLRSGHAAVDRLRAGKTLESTRKWSTSSTDLVMENVDDEFVQDFVLWRELDKLEGAFLAKFPNYLHNGRLYGTINRTGTTTGRFSSSNPNLQQIPAHGRYGPAVRGLFRGDLVVADYSQLENRVVAHFSEDPNLLRAYTENVDLYGLAASLLFGGEPTKDHEFRGLLKTTMLSLQYGAGYVKLAMLMTRGGHPTDPDGAKALVERIKRAFPRMFEWRDATVDQAIRDGVVYTIGGRRRRLHFKDGWAKQRHEFYKWKEAGQRRSALDKLGGMDDPEVGMSLTAERQAVNAVVSGSAADIIDMAMLACEREAVGDEYRTLIQVHDEILWERGRDWRGEESLAKIATAGETGHGFTLNVPLEFAPAEVSSWAEKGVTQTGEGHVVKDRLAKARGEGMQARKASDYAADVAEMRRQQRAGGSGDDKGQARAAIAAARAKHETETGDARTWLDKYHN